MNKKNNKITAAEYSETSLEELAELSETSLEELNANYATIMNEQIKPYIYLDEKN